MRFFKGGLVLATCVGLAQAALAQTSDFTLAPGDLVDVSVFARPDISRQYRVRADGTISLHLVGAIAAADLLPADLETEIEARLSATFNEPVSTTLEVAEWRPLTVTGDVMEPGAVPFRPGTDVRIAVALSGGFLRGQQMSGDASSNMRVQAEVGYIEQYEAQLAALLAEQDRLRADQVSDQALAQITALVGPTAAQELADSQADLGRALVVQASLEHDARSAQRDLASEEAEAYAQRQAVIGEQLAVTLEELGKQQELLERGIAVSSALLDLRQDAASLRSDELEALGLESAARQKVDRSVTGQRLAEATQARDRATRLADVQAEIVELQTQITESRGFVVAFGGSAMLGENDEARQSYVIFRRQGDEVLQMQGTADMLLHPGDIVDVTVSYAP